MISKKVNKKYVPLKYTIGMVMLFFVIPIALIISIAFAIGFSKLTITISILFGALIISGPIVYFKNQENASIVITDEVIINYINDGTSNFGWTEEIKSIKKIEVADNKQVKKHFKNCKSNKVLLIDFGFNNVKYISVSLFTNFQINKILMHIKGQKTERG